MRMVISRSGDGAPIDRQPAQAPRAEGRVRSPALGTRHEERAGRRKRRGAEHPASRRQAAAPPHGAGHPLTTDETQLLSS